MLKSIILSAVLWVVVLVGVPTTAAQVGAQPGPASAKPVSLRECLEAALLNNRVLQIERINPQIARLTLDATYGYYDPIFYSELRKEHAEDMGGFDPADLSRDHFYNADSEIAAGGLSGFLPSGMSYNLVADYAHSDGIRDTLNFDSYDLFTGVSARQPLLKNFWTDAGRTAISINKKSLKISELGTSFVMMDTINQVQQAYYEWLFAREDLDVRRNLLRAKLETLAGIRRQVDVGTLTVLEEKLARSSASRVDADLVTSSNLVVLAENSLRTLIGQTATDWKGTSLEPVEKLLIIPENLNINESWATAFSLRPDLAQMTLDVERVGLDVRYRRNQLFPSLDLVGTYSLRGSSVSNAIPSIPPMHRDASLSTAWDQIVDSDVPSHSFGVILSMPLGRAAERASYKAVKHLKEQAQLRLKQKEELVLREISDAMHNAKSAYDRAIATRRARDETREALDAEQQKFLIGTSSLFFVLQLQTELAAAESAEVRARADYNKALSQLHFAEGSLLARNKVFVELK